MFDTGDFYLFMGLNVKKSTLYVLKDFSFIQNWSINIEKMVFRLQERMMLYKSEGIIFYRVRPLGLLIANDNETFISTIDHCHLDITIMKGI